MKRRRLAPALVTCLPAELLQYIALFLADSETFFACLDAFQACNLLGDLLCFTKLRETMEPCCLWPQVRLGHSPTPSELASLEIAVKYTTGIQLGGIFDVHWLHRPSFAVTTISVYLKACPFEVPSLAMVHDWSIQLARLSVRHLDIPAIHVEALQPLFTAESSLSSLRLDLGSYPDALETILAFLRVSKLTSLTLDSSTSCCTSYSIPPHLFPHLISWLRREPVESLCLSYLDFRPVELLLPAFFDALALSTSLEHLTLKHSTLPVFSCQSLPPLKNFAVDECFMSSQAFSSLCSALNASDISSFTLTRHPVTWDASRGSIGDLVAGSSKLTTLVLRQMTLGEEDARQLCAGLKRSNVAELRLQDIGFRGRGLQILTEALPAIKSLRKLGLHGDFIGDRTCRCVGKILRASTLEHLDFSRNNITDMGAFHLSRGIAGPTKLKRLLLDYNRITVTGASALQRSFRRRTSISLQGNAMTPQDIAGLCGIAPTV
ncbi:unnamed protein product [Aphanomyces euteiches]